jgi:hypothetical protein
VYIDFGFRILRIDSESQKEEDEDKKFYILTYLETLFYLNIEVIIIHTEPEYRTLNGQPS